MAASQCSSQGLSPLWNQREQQCSPGFDFARGAIERDGPLDERSRAKEVLEAAGATDVSSTSEASVPKGSRASKRVVRAEFDGEVTRGSSDVVDQSAEESDVSPAPVLPSRDGANPSSSTRRPR